MRGRALAFPLRRPARGETETRGIATGPRCPIAATVIESRAADTFYEPLRDQCMSHVEELSRLHAINAARM